MIPGLCNLFQALKGTFGGLSVNASPGYVYATGSGTVATGSITATPSGGTPAYTYNWVFMGGDNSITPVSVHSATSTFIGTVRSGDDKVAYYQCNVTDSAAHMASSNQVTIEIQADS